MRATPSVPHMPRSSGQCPRLPPIRPNQTVVRSTIGWPLSSTALCMAKLATPSAKSIRIAMGGASLIPPGGHGQRNDELTRLRVRIPNSASGRTAAGFAQRARRI